MACGDLGVGLGERAPDRKVGLFRWPWTVPVRSAVQASPDRLHLLFGRGDLIDPALVASACERRLEPEREDLVGEPEAPRCVRPSRARWRRCARATAARCRDRCTARRGRRAPCSRRSARPGRCRRARCRARRGLRRPRARRRCRSADSRPAPRCACRGRRRCGRAAAACPSDALSGETRRDPRRSRCAQRRRLYYVRSTCTCDVLRSTCDVRVRSASTAYVSFRRMDAEGRTQYVHVARQN